MSFTLTALTITVVVSLGIIVGFFSGLLGIGGGVLLVPVLIKLFDLEPQKAIGISLAVIVPIAMAGAFRHGVSGDTNLLRFAVCLAIGGIIGALLGSTMGAYLSAASLKKVFGILMVFAGVNMLFDFTERIAGKSEAVAEESATIETASPAVELRTPAHKPS